MNKQAWEEGFNEVLEKEAQAAWGELLRILPRSLLRTLRNLSQRDVAAQSAQAVSKMLGKGRLSSRDLGNYINSFLIP